LLRFKKTALSGMPYASLRAARGSRAEPKDQQRV
jgi:hypothetical protein